MAQPFPWDAMYARLLEAQNPESKTRRQVRCVLRALRLPPGASILDVGCGYGRHTASLARAGMRVVGIDRSRAMILLARRRHGRAKNVQFRLADMRRLAYRARFDAVVCLYTSFGYFSKADNRRTLAGMARALKPGGLLLVDTREKGCVAHDAPPSAWWTYGRAFRVHETFRMNRTTGASTNRWKVMDLDRGRTVTRTLAIRYDSLAGWKRNLRAAGLRPLRTSGSYEGAPFRSPGSARLILVARRD